MPDQRSVMKEFRSLDEKRRAGGLTPEEEARHATLRDLIGPEMGAGGLRPGFDVNAAAARLRDSLLPAGLRNRPPPPPEPERAPPGPELEASLGEALTSAHAAEPFAPLEPEQGSDALFDPSSLGGEPGELPQPGEGAGWDPNQPYDPSAQAAWDPNQPYDPDAQAAWDPNQPHDPDAQAAWDPNQPYDPDAQSADPGLAEGELPSWDDAEAAGGADDGAARVELSSEGDIELGAASPEADGFAPASWGAEPPAPAPPEPAPTGEYDADVPWMPSTEEGAEAALPFDPATASAIGPGDLASLGAEGEFGDAPGFSPPDHPPDLPPDASGFQATRGVPPDVRGWQPEGPLDEGFQLESGGSFDAAASAVAPEWAVAESAPWAEDGAGEVPAADVDVQEVDLGESVASATAGEPPPDEVAAPGADAGAWDLEEEGSVEAGSSFEPGATAAEAWSAGVPEEPGAPGSSPDPEVVADPSLVSTGDWAEPEPLPEEPPVGPPRAEPAPALDFSRPDFSSAEEEAFVDAGTSPPSPEEPARPETDAAPEPELPSFDLGAEVPPPSAADATLAPAGDDDIPTIDGEEILEEIPVEEASPPPAEVAAEYRIPGAHRVVVHTVEGHVRRGILTDADLAADSLSLAAQPEEAPVAIPTDQVKAIFFMLAPGEKAPAPEGKKVRVTFRDGRQVAGFGPEYREDGPGFFMIPGDTRTNTGRIWVYRDAVRQVVVS